MGFRACARAITCFMVIVDFARRHDEIAAFSAQAPTLTRRADFMTLRKLFLRWA